MWGPALTAVLALSCSCTSAAEQLWERDLTDQIAIGASLRGYTSVTLSCGAEHMQLQVQLDEDFSGVLYARGAFHSKEAPCFLDASGGRNFTLRLPYDRCNTRNEDEVYSNSIIVQHDDELIMPGDAAFKIECNFKLAREFTVTAELDQQRGNVQSRITLADADPASKDPPANNQITVAEDSDTVTFNPRKIRSIKDEL